MASHLVGESVDPSPQHKTACGGSIQIYECNRCAVRVYEMLWGDLFHYAPCYRYETVHESLLRHEYKLALHGAYSSGDRVLDIGCRVGGAMRNIARFTGANVVGINDNPRQVARGRKLDARTGLWSQCSYVKCSPEEMPFKCSEYDGAYAIESLSSCADRLACYREIFRVIKPGTCFVGYEWILTDKYDDANEYHRQVRNGIEFGHSIAPLLSAAETSAMLKAAGFEVEEAFDEVERVECSTAKHVPWYVPLESGLTTLSGLRATALGKWFVLRVCSLLESCRLMPQGSTRRVCLFDEAVVSLRLGGELEIFSPAFFFKARKPMKAASSP